MSRIFLPAGGSIEVYGGWTSSNDDHGNTNYYSKEDKTYIATVHASGVVHLSNSCNYRYYPPEVKNIEHAYEIVLKHLKDLYPSQLAALKKELTHFDARSKSFK